VQLQLPEFDVLFADTVEDACALLARHGAQAELLAGGTDLLVKMKLKNRMPRYLVNVKRIPGLDRIRDEAGGLRIGALATAQAIQDSALVRARVPVLARTAGVLGTEQIRTVATLGGNLANASPSAEFGPPLLVLGASVHCLGRGGERTIPIGEFFLAPGKSALRQDEMITGIHVPALPEHARCIYLKHSLRRMDVAMAGVAVFVQLEGDVCREVGIALGAVAPTPFRARAAEAALRGRRLTGDAAQAGLLEEVARIACGESSPIDDLRGYASYRRRIVAMMVKQGLGQTIARVREDA
jgi:CO/xanthine dehydrogenase FAD-binding subunit